MTFELAGGSIVGTDHRAIPKNNQDAWYVASRGDVTVGVVCDGCGSSPHSEVGAQLGARLIGEAVLRHTQVGVWSFDFIQGDVLASLRILALQMGGHFSQAVYDYFLFSTVGVVLCGYSARFFSLGDGVIVVNEVETQIGPYPENEPPYLGYALLGERVKFEVHHALSQGDLDHFLIGCDGAGRPGLLQVCDGDLNLPGMGKPVGRIRQFWEDDAVFSNPDVLRRRLKLIARDWHGDHGLLSDDTTIIVGRKGSE